MMPRASRGKAALVMRSRELELAQGYVRWRESEQSDLEPTFWAAVQVKPNHESKVARHLDCRGCCYYVPTYRTARQWSDRKKEAAVPLFPGYVFCRYCESGRKVILSTPSVLRILGVGGHPEAVSDDELSAVHRIVTSGLACEPAAYLQSGDRVRITRGALKGLQGIVLGFKGNQYRFLVSLSLLQRSVAVEVDVTSCEAVDDPQARTRYASASA